MIRRVGPSPDPNIRYRLRPGVYAILPMRGGLLVTLQTDPGPELQLPGGGIDPGESPLRALHREVFEETGWHISAPRRLGAFRRFIYMPEYDMWAEKICTIYRARPVRQIGPPSEPDHTPMVISAAHAATELGNSGDRLFVTKHCL
ncbi:NUDIX hydrolase [Pseudohalocynthiibacter aestuariivivens]|uniref:NUDIX hydrolase n=1 Tax=Roseovarius pelagicus TaxID=2980108 RepID=A0ABY6D9P0_9RHOB|nr:MULTISPECIES: NUDIX hydrolase [Rhodobacterales]QIE46135.1 NUDIX hydrolase [Pseudohalocynthiibacter aestuariivivens]UXX81903.1 NUDIX hydrolase [Roseovarius pelagicus]